MGFFKRLEEEFYFDRPDYKESQMIVSINQNDR